MSEIVQISDFESGVFSIATNTFQEADFQAYLDKIELQYLAQVLGAELYTLFIADLVGGIPQDPIYVTIFNAFILQNDCDFCQSVGMKQMVMAFVYFHYVRDTYTRQTTNGVEQVISENSISLDTQSHDFSSKYNSGVDTYRCIQKKICENISDYPTYKGILLKYVISTF